MKELVIIGASGFGRDVVDIVKVLPNYGDDIVVKGFVVHKEEYLNSMDYYPQYPPILGLVKDYKIRNDEVFLCTLGDVNEKKSVVQELVDKGAEFYTLIHPTARISPTATIGKGTIVEANATIGAGALVGNHCLIQTSSVVAHDNVIGDFSRLDCNVVCVGNVIVEEGVTIHTSAVINHGVRLGAYSKVGALSFVIRKVENNTTVYGNPAKILV